MRVEGGIWLVTSCLEFESFKRIRLSDGFLCPHLRMSLAANYTPRRDCSISEGEMFLAFRLRCSPRVFSRWFWLVMSILSLSGVSPAGVVINEFMAAATERKLTWDAEGVPQMGSGLSWQNPSFDAGGWSGGLLPAGYGFSGLALDLTSQMKGKAPSLYLRKPFLVTAAQAVSTNALTLWVSCNDGFVAYLNGHEVARANCGPTNHFMWASQPAYNVSTSTNVLPFALGQAAKWLLPSDNILAIQAHNADQPSTTNAPERIVQHLPTPEFLFNAGLDLAGDNNSPTPAALIPLGTNAGSWQYFVGRAEPSGGVVDMGLLNTTFKAPAGQEDDYDQPAAFSDWVELYNDGPGAVDLAGWSLTDDPNLVAKWRFPTNTSLSAGGFLLVLCDGRDEANAPAGPATRLHANFKLSDKGGYLALFDLLGQLADYVPPNCPSQTTFCSYGRRPGLPDDFGFLGTATPGTPNVGPWYPARVDPPQFQDSAGLDLHGGIYRTQFLSLYLTNSTPGSLIRYTRNGADPTEFNSLVYSNPLALAQSNDKTGIVVRARAFLPGLLPSEVKTYTFMLRQPSALTNAPALIFTGDSGRAFYAPDGLLAIKGGQYVPVNSGEIWQANGPQSYDQVLGMGQPSERESHLEWYFPPGIYPTNQGPLRVEMGLRVSASSYSCPRLKLTAPAANSPWPPFDFREKPSLNLYFSGDYDSGPLNYQLFTNYTVKDFQHLRLRAGKNDMSNPFMTDELVRRLWIEMGHAGARGLFCPVYFNGVYRGVYNLCERFREPFFQAHYGSQAQWDVNYIYSWVDGDSTAYTQLLNLLDGSMTSLTYWRSVTNRLDIDNTADYYLLNIYCAMWDWPQNNFVVARERSNGPDSRFRFAVWDAEGAFNAIGAGKTAAYNTLTNELVVPAGNSNYWTDLTHIFRRLVIAPEFRIRFADRVNLHMFNGGLLDDRDPDGAGPLKCRFVQRVDEMGREVGDLVKYNTGQSLNLNAFYSWTSSANGRRSYLLGTVPGRQMLRDSGLWPLTEPPVFSQFGGAVPPGYALSMTSAVATASQTATIYFTRDGTDPRLVGGSLNPVVETYANPVPIDQLTTINARAQNNATGEWSPLTTATFAPAAVPASSQNLVLAELMYHPPAVTAAEGAAGFNNVDDFEFVRLLNLGATPLYMGGVRFTLGITFDFSGSSLRYLLPGASALVVKRRVAFQLRYGHALDATIAGEYGGNLSNRGERLQLLAADSAAIRDFSYGDQPPWPPEADGNGPSLLLRQPWSNPDPGNPANWTSSAVPGGLPGGLVPNQSYAIWRALYWDPASSTNNLVSGPDADPDGDGWCNFLEYAFGLNPHVPSSPSPLTPTIEVFESDPGLVLTIRLAPGARDATFLWESSVDLASWSPANAAIELVATESLYDGTSRLKYVDRTALSSQGSRFIRLRVSGP